MDRRPELDVIDSAFGVPASIRTLPDQPILAATAILLVPPSVEVPAGGDLTVQESRGRISLRRDQVGAVPRSSEITFADGRRFIVDGIDSQDDQTVKYFVRAVSPIPGAG